MALQRTGNAGTAASIYRSIDAYLRTQVGLRIRLARTPCRAVLISEFASETLRSDSEKLVSKKVTATQSRHLNYPLGDAVAERLSDCAVAAAGWRISEGPRIRVGKWFGWGAGEDIDRGTSARRRRRASPLAGYYV